MTITISNVPESMSEKSAPRSQKYQGSTEYIQLGQDGLNTNLKEYSLTFKDTPANIEALDSTLSGLNSTTAFLWNPYSTLDITETNKTFICQEWTSGYDSPGYYTLTATFKQVPDVV